MPHLGEGFLVKVYSILGIICLLTAVLLSCVAGIYAATNETVASAIAFAAFFALLSGVRWVADKR